MQGCESRLDVRVKKVANRLTNMITFTCMFISDNGKKWIYINKDISSISINLDLWRSIWYGKLIKMISMV